MKKVYESSTALEAHMVKNLLAQEDISSQINGEYLQGGVGELQAIGVVKVMVDESDYIKAKGIIDNWESTQTTISNDKPNKSSSAANGFIAGVILTMSIIYFIYSSPVSTDGIDYNNDDFLDEKWIYRNRKLQELHIDRNQDRIYDIKYYYSNKGIVKYAEADDNFDGVFESKIIIRNGNYLREESDKDQDGIIDYRVNYKFGVIDNIEFIDKNSGKVIKRQLYKMGKLVSADYDSNGDGNYDTHHEYDSYEEVK